MLEWPQAAPLIGVLLTAFLGLIGTLLAARRRESHPGALAAVPAAIAGAIAERGVAEGLTLAIGHLTAAMQKIADERDRTRDEEAADIRRRHRELMDELRQATDALKAISAATGRRA